MQLDFNFKILNFKSEIQKIGFPKDCKRDTYTKNNLFMWHSDLTDLLALLCVTPGYILGNIADIIQQVKAMTTSVRSSGNQSLSSPLKIHSSMSGFSVLQIDPLCFHFRFTTLQFLKQQPEWLCILSSPGEAFSDYSVWRHPLQISL